MPFKNVLDIGAGRGDDLILAKGVNQDAKLYAIESYAPNVDYLKTKEISVFSCNLECEQFPFDDGSVDIIIANQILEHTKEVFWIFHEVARILPIGGKLIIGVPNLASLHNRILLSFGRQPTSIQMKSAHVRGFTKSDLIKFLESCFPGGFVLKEFAGSNFYPFPHFFAKPFAHLLPTFSWSIFFLFEKTREYQNQFLVYPEIKQLETNFFLGEK